ncbi:MAG: hypothetical protein V4482_03435 [Pseudomonadota bacterium]
MGLQGSGKSTHARMLQHALEMLGCKTTYINQDELGTRERFDDALRQVRGFDVVLVDRFNGFKTMRDVAYNVIHTSLSGSQRFLYEQFRSFADDIVISINHNSNNNKCRTANIQSCIERATQRAEAGGAYTLDRAACAGVITDIASKFSTLAHESAAYATQIVLDNFDREVTTREILARNLTQMLVVIQSIKGIETPLRAEDIRDSVELSLSYGTRILPPMISYIKRVTNPHREHRLQTLSAFPAYNEDDSFSLLLKKHMIKSSKTARSVTYPVHMHEFDCTKSPIWLESNWMALQEFSPSVPFNGRITESQRFTTKITQLECYPDFIKAYTTLPTEIHRFCDAERPYLLISSHNSAHAFELISRESPTKVVTATEEPLLENCSLTMQLVVDFFSYEKPVYGPPPAAKASAGGNKGMGTSGGNGAKYFPKKKW